MKSQLKIVVSTGLCCLGIFTLSPLLLGRMTSLQAQVTSSPQPSVSSPGMGKMGMMNDQHFIIMMIPHHESAIAMADLALTRAQHPEIKQLATNIKISQSKEIEQMRASYKKWYGTSVPKLNSNSTGGGMHGGNMGMMSNMNTDLTALRNAKNFDQVFIEEMIPHHQMAVMMSQHLITTSLHPEMQKLSQAIIQAQNKEIQQMQAWYQKWYPSESK
jgi:uncharacterized protein (DUF305 family)